jgi:hypothetical protein
MIKPHSMISDCFVFYCWETWCWGFQYMAMRQVATRKTNCINLCHPGLTVTDLLLLQNNEVLEAYLVVCLEMWPKYKHILYYSHCNMKHDMYLLLNTLLHVFSNCYIYTASGKPTIFYWYEILQKDTVFFKKINET